ncbi:MAG: L,D-transpeptidase family protein, partial [Bellilinea sp.]
GTPRSHGCVNMRSEEAKWLFRWVTPVNEPGTVEQRGYGTRVVVI